MKLAIAIVLLVLLPIAYAQTADEAFTAITKAETDAQEMKELGLGTSYVIDALKAAKSAMEEKDYALAVKKAADVSERKEKALSIKDSIRALELRIEEVSAMELSVTGAEEELAKAKRAFEMENYGEAEDAVFKGNGALHETEAEYTLLNARYRAARDNMGSYIRDNWIVILFAAAVAIALAFIAYKKYEAVAAKRKARDMELEKRVLEDMTKKAQQEYFNEGTISKSSYEARVKKCRGRIREIDGFLLAIKKLTMEE